MFLNLKKGLAFCLLVFMVQAASASVTLDKTRILFISDEQEQTVNVFNADATPTLVQSWVSKGEARSNDFLATPPLFRLEGKMNSNLRVVKMNQNLPQDIESLYILNVKSVPPSDPGLQNTLSFAFNTRIKLIYRPYALTNDTSAIDAAPTKLLFSISSNKKELTVRNPTPFYVFVNEFKLGAESLSVTDGFIPPKGEIKLAIKKPITKYEISWTATSATGAKYEEQTKPVR